jgi:MoaA/NifB/PqqE/SkfB family radical SAM enzyme
VAEVDMSLVDKYLPDAELVSVSNTGDAFGSKAHRQWLQNLDGSKYPKLEVELFTNGLLLPRYWGSLHKIHKNIVRVRMSIDAATAETYERVRPPGKWHQVIQALEFISELKLPHFVCNFCVQKANVNEAPDFVDLVTGYGATEVVFNVLRLKEYFEGLGVGPASKADVKRILEDERMQRPEIFCPMLHGYVSDWEGLP